MSSAFFSETSFNEDISGWDVSKVKNMNEMFVYASSFNKALIWNVSKVIIMGGMFAYASLFNQDLSFLTKIFRRGTFRMSLLCKICLKMQYHLM
jgi:surface protein